MPKLKMKTRTGGRYVRTAVLAAAAASLVGVGSLAAVRTARADTTDILLNQLYAKHILGPREYHRLKARHAREKAAAMRRHYVPGMVVKGPQPEYVTVCPKHICMHVGAVDVRLSGDLVFGGVETFKRYGGAAPVGGLVTASPNQPYNSIQAGLLPSAIVVSLATHQMGYDLGFTVGAYIGGSSVNTIGGANANGAGYPTALGTPGIDLRQIFGTIGTPTFGTVKIGRDLGLFGSDAILNDATLLGMGSPLTTFAPGNTTLGRIGIGYVYADWIPQVTYTSPDFDGFTASIGAFTPLRTGATTTALVGLLPAGSFGTGASALYTGQSVPMIQGQVKWKGSIAPGANVTLSTDALWQHHTFDGGTGSFAQVGARSNVDSWGVDGFGKLDIDNFSFVGYGYYGRGLGTTGFFLQGFDLQGNPRRSYGGYAQASYTFFHKFTVGGSWGISGLDATALDGTVAATVANGGLVHYNESAIGFARYQLTTWMALQAEFVHTWAYSNAGASAQSDALWAGTAWFF